MLLYVNKSFNSFLNFFVTLNFDDSSYFIDHILYTVYTMTQHGDPTGGVYDLVYGMKISVLKFK